MTLLSGYNITNGYLFSKSQEKSAFLDVSEYGQKVLKIWAPNSKNSKSYKDFGEGGFFSFFCKNIRFWATNYVHRHLAFPARGKSLKKSRRPAGFGAEQRHVVRSDASPFPPAGSR